MIFINVKIDNISTEIEITPEDIYTNSITDDLKLAKFFFDNLPEKYQKDFIYDYLEKEN